MEELVLIPSERKGTNGWFEIFINAAHCLAIFINVYDCYGVKICKDNKMFEVYCLHAEKEFKRVHATHIFVTQSADEAKAWVDALEHVITGTKIGGI